MVKIIKKPLCLCFFAIMLYVMTGCGQTQKSEVSAGQSGDTLGAAASEQICRGTIIQNDTKLHTMTLQDLGSEIQTDLSYDAVTKVTDEYDQDIEAEDVEVGMIMEASYRPSEGKIISMQVPKDVWIYREVTDYSVNAEEKSMEFAGSKFQYQSATYIGDQGKKIEMMDLNTRDELTVRGTGYEIFSIVRTKGHGYIRLKNYSGFLGGMLQIGERVFLPISKKMLVTVPEGEQKVVLTKGTVHAEKNVIVQLDEVSTADFSAYANKVPQIGKVKFCVKPAGADMTINGSTVDYSKPLRLYFGTYQISVSMTGYESYSGLLKIGETSKKVHIHLVEESENASEEDPESTDAGESSDETTSSVAETKKMDSAHKITVSEPEGAEVYLDDVYEGVAPCSFTKIIGSQTVTLSKDGYTTKSYSVNILDDDENVTLKFPALLAASSSE